MIHQLIQIRIHWDAAAISQALVNLQKLKKLNVGDYFSIDGKTIRSSWGAAKLFPFGCVTEHCKPEIGWIRALRVGLLIQIMDMMRTSPLPEIGVSWGIDEYEAAMNLHGLSKDPHARRITDIQLGLRPEHKDLRAKGMYSLINIAYLESLEVQYLPSQDPVRSLFIRLLELQKLQRIILNGLHARRRAFSDFFRRYPTKLKRVSVINCSIAVRVEENRKAEKPQWKKVMRHLKNIKDLDFLHLEKLRHEHSESGLRGGLFRPIKISTCH
jgi:hypothetical protein